MRSKLIQFTAVVLVLGLACAGLALAAKTKKIGGSATFSLTTPAANVREAPFSGDLDVGKQICRKKRTITLLPASANFPNTTGYIATAKSSRSGAFSGVYQVPGKKDTYSFTLLVEKVKRTLKGTTYVCKAIRAPAQSVTTS